MKWNSGGITTWNKLLFGYRHLQPAQNVTRQLLSSCAQKVLAVFNHTPNNYRSVTVNWPAIGTFIHFLPPHHPVGLSVPPGLVPISIVPIIYMYITSCQGHLCDVATLQGKSHFCIPFLGNAGPQSQFPHSCVCERFIYSQDQSTYFPAAE